MLPQFHDTYNLYFEHRNFKRRFRSQRFISEIIRQISLTWQTRAHTGNDQKKTPKSLNKY